MRTPDAMTDAEKVSAKVESHAVRMRIDRLMPRHVAKYGSTKDQINNPARPPTNRPEYVHDHRAAAARELSRSAGG